MINYPEKFLMENTETFKFLSKIYDIGFVRVMSAAILETGWGRYVPGNNMFGIKGNDVLLTTKEFLNGEKKQIKDKFANFQTPEESIIDYLQLICRSRRYQKVYQARFQKPSEYFRKIQDCGYATDPDYSKKLTDIYYSVIERLISMKRLSEIDSDNV